MSQVTFHSSDVESILRDGDLSKPLSTVYKYLFPETTKLIQPCRMLCTAVVPDMDDEDWKDVWEVPFNRLVSARDRLIHYKFLLLKNVLHYQYKVQNS